MDLDNVAVAESNPLFNPSATDFRPSLCVILEDNRESREASSYFREASTSEGVKAKVSSASSSDDSVRQDAKADGSAKQEGGRPQRRLSTRLSSLSRMILPPTSGKTPAGPEEAGEYSVDEKRTSTARRRSSLRQLFVKS